MSFEKYLHALGAALKQGDATEHTHRPALKNLIESLAPRVIATNEPKRIACGAPDYIVTRGGVPLGYIEAKDVNIDLVKTESDEQLSRYRVGLRNLILTDYLEFRLYRNGELVQTSRLGRWQKNGVLRREPNGIEQTQALLTWFIQSDAPTITRPSELAQRMAHMTRILRDLIAKAFTDESERGELHGQLDAFRKILLGEDLSTADFGDIYAQTISYGLFAARCNHVGSDFTREGAAKELPKTNPFLRKLFQNIAGADLDDRIAWAVDDLADLLAKADISEILVDFGRATRQEDPVVHFYETFLAAYDPRLRESRGVYYTPEPVVGYIVRSVDAILKNDFGLPEGLADSSKVSMKRPTGKINKKGEPLTETVETHRVQILDPATGTGTFLYTVIQQIRESFGGNAGMWPGYVAEHLLPRIYGFELLMAPYAVAHMKLGLVLKESGYDFASDERLRVYLTNTLEKAHELSGLPLFTQWLAEEAAQAGEIKISAPIMVVLGNPPYSGHSVNKGSWISGLMQEYKKSPAIKKPGQGKWLSDDYVKFIRFSQWRIEQTGYGVLAFVTNHSYLDNPTFCDMRTSLMSTFDDLYMLDLHGSTKKREKAPAGGKDENVFDIQQGVAIALMVKRVKSTSSHTVQHADLHGTRASKYDWLNTHSVLDTSWNTIFPTSPANLFVPQNSALLAEYQAWWSLPAIFNQNGDPAPGIVTTQDQFAVSWSEREAVEKVEILLLTKNEEEARSRFSLCTQSQWSYDKAKRELADGAWRAQTKSVHYRPFDLRWTIYNGNVAVHRRERMMNHMLAGENLALCTVRQLANDPWQHALAATTIVDDCYVSNRTKERGYAFPLYLYADAGERADLFVDDSIEASRRVNLSTDFIAQLEFRLELKFTLNGQGDLRTEFGPEDVYHYIYAVLYIPTYRSRYVDFLKRDFPRIPLPSNLGFFVTLCDIGEKLVSLHIMRNFGVSPCAYPIAGSNRIDKVRFEPPARMLDAPTNVIHGRVYINAEQYFDGISEVVWNYSIGSYQVAHKWLKDRKGRLLTFSELQHYQRIVSILAETIRLQNTLDEFLKNAGGWPPA